METKDLRFINISITKKVKIEYEVLKEDRTYDAKDDEYPDPDFEKAMKDFQPDFAKAFDKMDHEVFKITGVSFSSKKDQFFVALKGKMKTTHDNLVTVTSGEILIIEGSAMADKVKLIKNEAFQYLFEGKSAQKKIDFKGSEK